MSESMLLLPAFASAPVEQCAAVEMRDPSLPIEWSNALDELQDEPLGEALSGEFIVPPERPSATDPSILLPPSTPYPKKGIKPFGRLNIKHRRILALHMKGWSDEEIGKAMGVGAAAIQTTLRNPTTQDVLVDYLSGSAAELRALGPLVVERMRRTLTAPTDQRVGLQAVDLYNKTQHRYKDAPEAARTAEDVIQEILKIRTEGAADITIARQEVKRDV